jgi:hypothetical protein
MPELRWDYEHPEKVFVKEFGFSEETADKIVNKVARDVLFTQLPGYWARDWIRVCEQKCSKRFLHFLENLRKDELGFYDGKETGYLKTYVSL